MFKTIAATALSATLALGTLAPRPAQALEQGDLAKLLVGVGIAAVLAKSIHDRQEEEKKKDDRKNDRRDWRPSEQTYRYPYPQNQHRSPLIQPYRPWSGAPHTSRAPVAKPPRVQDVYRIVPRTCERTFRSDGSYREFVTRACLERSGIRTAGLPTQCERILDMPGDIQNRRAWNSDCLQRNGYRIR
ncbi:hypothetical protein [Tropicimonas isoalkanivorans]|uniref:Uncharacterized protein n=1 Tax=Tropicimonas isoalkanivorans TaxID=441112 RepID=A0A1I1KWX3_9RHOB|nr:hypothetical protein [Tropicimonas isoalkanivorans]SFC65231.1 hypothetical protein SAMN04488094_107114 [Tropicimonas isoalkanivorans]